MTPMTVQAQTQEQKFITVIREELDSYLVALKQLNTMPPDEVFVTISGITARLAEIRVNLVRTDARRMTALRTKEVDPILEECDRQFRLHSRIQAVRQLEMDQTRHIT